MSVSPAGSSPPPKQSPRLGRHAHGMLRLRVLKACCEYGPMRSGDLAERLGATPSTIRTVVDRLYQAGLLERPELGLYQCSPQGRAHLRRWTE